jgi:hypothetical protein
MKSTKRPPLLVRVATLSLALAALSGLVVHASLSAGCGTPSSGAPVASAEAQPVVPVSASASTPARHAPAPASSHRYGVAFPATKAAQVFFPDDEQPAPAGSARGR